MKKKVPQTMTVGSGWEIIKYHKRFYMRHLRCPKERGAFPREHPVKDECIECGATAPDDVVHFYRLVTM